jgi:choline kinase
MVEHLKKIDIVIPCAGMGTRLGYLTQKITKNMVKIKGYSILEHQLSKFNLHSKQINSVIFILGYKSKVLKTHILKLTLPYEIKFYTNKEYKKTACAYSISLAVNHLKNDTIFINSDLILNQKTITNIFNKKKSNFVYLRKSLQNNLKRPVKAKIHKNRIIKIGMNQQNFDLDVVGPFRLNFSAILILKKIQRTIDVNYLKKLSCYEFLGELVNFVKLEYDILKDNDWYEINTVKEYNKSLNNKIFNINLDFHKNKKGI